MSAHETPGPKIRQMPEQSDDEDYFDDMLCDRLRGSMLQHGEMSRTQFPRRRKPRRAELSQKQRKWLNQKDNFVEKVVKDLFKEESKRMTVLNTPIRLIKAADSPSSADQLAGDLLENMDKDGGEFFETGFDVEGEFGTTQLYTVANDVVHAYVFQMNKICVDGKLPPKVQQLMEDKRLIFVGKNVEKEVKEFFDLFGCDPARRVNILFVDVLHLIQT